MTLPLQLISSPHKITNPHKLGICNLAGSSPRTLHIHPMTQSLRQSPCSFSIPLSLSPFPPACTVAQPALTSPPHTYKGFGSFLQPLMGLLRSPLCLSLCPRSPCFAGTFTICTVPCLDMFLSLICSPHRSLIPFPLLYSLFYHFLLMHCPRGSFPFCLVCMHLHCVQGRISGKEISVRVTSI